MAHLQKEDASKRQKSQKTLRTLAHQSNFSLLFNVCRWQIKMAHWFQTSSAQRKQITSICQNYNGTAAKARCFQKPKSQKTLRTVVHQPTFSLLFDVCKWQITMAHWFQTSSAQRKQVTSLCQNYNGTAAEARCFQRPKSQKTLRTVAHQSALSKLSNVCISQITMAHWFQTSSAPRKQITSICQNY